MKVTCILTGMEMVGPSKRMWAGMIIEYFFAMGLVILTGIGYLLRDWNHVEMAIAFPNLLFISYFWYVSFPYPLFYLLTA